MTDDARAHVERLLQETREELGRAEGRAATLLGATGVMVAVFATLSAESGWSPTDLRALAAVFWWLGTAAAVGAFVSLALVLWPRKARASAQGWPRWFGEIVLEARRGTAGEDPVAEFTRRLRDSTPDPFGRACHQLWVVSQIAHAKLAWTRVALVLIAGSVFLTLTSLALDAAWR